MSAHYVGEKVDVDVLWSLGQDHHFAEKRVKITVREQRGLKRVILGRPTLTAEGLNIVCYRHPNFDRIAAHHPGIRRAPGLEPVRTFFGRTAKGGFFTGVEMPFDESSVNGSELILSYAPSLKVRRDLFDWPASGRVDGSAHFVGGRGIIFLFNPTPEARPVQFRLTEDEVGLKAKGVYEVVQEYPECTGIVRCVHGEVLNWEVPGQSALILRVEPLEGRR